MLLDLAIDHHPRDRPKKNAPKRWRSHPLQRNLPTPPHVATAHKSSNLRARIGQGQAVPRSGLSTNYQRTPGRRRPMNSAPIDSRSRRAVNRSRSWARARSEKEKEKRSYEEAKRGRKKWTKRKGMRNVEREREREKRKEEDSSSESMQREPRKPRSGFDESS